MIRPPAILLLTSLILSPCVWAARVGPSADPWDSVDARFSAKTLCEAFVDGASYVFERETCSSLGCDTWQYTVKTFCGASSDGILRARIEQWKEGKEFFQDELTESDWKAVHGDLLRAKANSAQSFGNTFTIDALTETASGDLRVDYTIASGTRTVEKGNWLLGKGSSVALVKKREATQFGLIEETSTDTLLGGVP